jgi:hypothetical protein
MMQEVQIYDPLTDGAVQVCHQGRSVAILSSYKEVSETGVICLNCQYPVRQGAWKTDEADPGLPGKVYACNCGHVSAAVVSSVCSATEWKKAIDPLGHLEELEAFIKKEIDIFFEVGARLLEIRNDKLYRLRDYKTFEAYVNEHLGIGRQYAYRLVNSVKVIENLSPLATKLPLPTNESQTRPLAGLEAEEQQKVWAEAVETAPNGKVTGDHVRSVKRKVLKLSSGSKLHDACKRKDRRIQKQIEKDRQVLRDMESGKILDGLNGQEAAVSTLDDLAGDQLPSEPRRCCPTCGRPWLEGGES